jgi:co-chaperonin GroES (HSP10)
VPNLASLLEPMPGKIVVQVDVRNEIGEGGLYLPEGIVNSVHEQRPTQGVIVAMSEYDLPDDMGDDLASDLDLVDLKIGDRVVFGRYSGTQISYSADKSKPKEKVIILTRKDILCRVKQVSESSNIQVKG